MITLNDQEVVITGKIAFDNAEQLYKEGLKLIQNSKQFPMIFNLSGLENGSTLALAVLVRWLRQAPDISSIQFKDVPDKMLKIIQSCHLEHDIKLI